jgi:adenosylcobyric acid synthase
MVEHADAAAVLVSDIDRGGSVAHLYGTWSLVPEPTRDRLAGYVLNRFRGDETLLSPGPELLTDRTAMAHVGTLPMLRHELPDEEGATVRADPPAGAPRVAIIRFPYGSNLDEFRLLHHVARVVWTDDPEVVASAEWVVLPGSKHVAADLAWMRSRRLDGAVLAAVARGRRVHGVCGGAMMLGRSIDDPTSTESTELTVSGLGVLTYRTVIEPDKLVTAATVSIEGLEIAGYELRHGRPAGPNGESVPVSIRSGNVSATTVHGLFEDPRLLDRWFGRPVVDPLPATFDLLADAMADHLDTPRLGRLAGM